MQAFVVNDKKKEAIQKSFYKHNFLTYTIYAYLLISVAVFVWWFIFTRNWNHESFITIKFCVVASLAICTPFMYIVLRIARRRICGRYTTERINESLIINDDVIEYGYQNYADSTPYDRVVVRIKDYTATIKGDKVTFHGAICQKYYDDFLTGETRADDSFKNGAWIIYDYFEPSLINCLQENLK